MRRLFKPKDFYDAFGITGIDLTSYYNFQSWQEICERAADAANDTLKYKGRIKPGDRVSVSTYFIYDEKVRGLVMRTSGEKPGQITVLLDYSMQTISVYPNQCKRLVKKKK